MRIACLLAPDHAMHDWRIILRCERLNCGRPKERPGGNDTQRNEREHPIEMRFGKEHHEAVSLEMFKCTWRGVVWTGEREIERWLMLTRTPTRSAAPRLVRGRTGTRALTRG